jgi:hypothetical protein
MFSGCLVVFGLSCLLFWADTRVIRDAPAWNTFEFCQYAEIGKNLAEEGTFDTRLVEPMALAMIDHDAVGPSSKRWPVVNRYPLPCLAVAGFMRILGPTDLAAAWSNGLAISLLATLTYALAWKWFGARWAGVVAFLFLTNPAFYGVFVLLGTPDVWFAFFFVMELAVWSDFDPLESRSRPGWAVGLGILGGLAYLSRFNALIFLAIQAGVLLRHRRWRELGLMILASTVVSSPMLIDNLIHFRRPFVSIYSAWNLLDGIGAYPIEPWLCYRVPDVARELWTHLGGVASKFATNLFVTVPREIWSLWRLEVLIPAGLMGIWTAPRGSSLRRFARWSVGLFALQLVLFSALRLEIESNNWSHKGRYFFWFAAPVLLLAVGTMSRLAKGRRWVQGIVALAIIGQVWLFGTTWVKIVREQRAAEIGFGRDPIRQLLKDVVQENRVIASTQPQITTWTCGLRSVSLPAEWEDLERINRNSTTPIDYLFLDFGFQSIQLNQNWLRIFAQDPRDPSPWEKNLLGAYDYVIPPHRTRPIGYILLRRKGVPLSELDRFLSRQ